MTADIWKVSLLIFLLSLLELYLLFRCAQTTLRHRLISSLTPVRIGDLPGMALGKTDWVAVQGTVSCHKPLKSRYLGATCVYYRSKVSQSGLGSGLFSKSEGVLFDLSDETGTVLVDPREAEVLADQERHFQFDAKQRTGVGLADSLVSSLVDPLLGKALTAVGIPNESLARSDLGRLEGTFVGSETVVSPGDDIFAVGPLKRVSGRLVLTSSLSHRTPTFLTNLSRAAYLQRLGGQARKFLVGLVVNSLVIALVVSIVRHYGFVAPW